MSDKTKAELVLVANKAKLENQWLRVELERAQQHLTRRLARAIRAGLKAAWEAF